MDSFLKQKTIHANGILDLLENAKMSKKGHKSTRQPFFMQGGSSDFKAGHDTLPEIPESLNSHIKVMYELIGDPNKEVYIGEWTILSLNKSLQNYKQYCDDGQKNIFDIDDIVININVDGWAYKCLYKNSALHPTEDDFFMHDINLL